MVVLKVLVFGNVDESLEQAIIKGNSLTKSKNGPFDMLILLATRRVFEGAGAEALEKLRTGQLSVDLAANLVIVDETADEKEVAFDHDKMRILYSGVRQVRTLTTLGGLTLGWVGHGAPGRIEGRKLVDILVSGSIPAHANPAAPPDSGHRALAGVLAGRVLPRYHFAPGKEFFERAPYKSPLVRTHHAGDDNENNNADDEEDSKMRVTRFITLGAFGGKERWFYAFNLDLDTTKPVEIPAGTTVNPYEAYRQQVRQEQHGSKSHDGGDGTHKRARGEGLPARPAKRQARVVTPSECFLCLSNPTLETHLITSIAENTYLALAKGPLLEAAVTQPGKVPGHLIVVPISHIPALPADPEVRGPLETERTRYITALHRLFNAQAAAAPNEEKPSGVVTVAFDLSRTTGVHYHTQVMAVPAAQADALETAFKKYQQLNEIDASSVTSELAPETTNFFRFQITRAATTTDTDTTTFVIPLGDDPRRRFDLQFGRRVVAEVLSLAHRMDWRACEQTKAEEEQDASVFKAAFAELDPAAHPELYSTAEEL